MAKPASNSSTIAPAMVSSLFATARRSTGVYRRCKTRTTRVSVWVLGNKGGASGGGDGKGREQPSRQSIGVGLRHRRENVPFDAAEREQWQEACDDDSRREEDRTVDVDGGEIDCRELARKSR